jgi:oxygen-dependent protoporphyrinogen oxidase
MISALPGPTIGALTKIEPAWPTSSLWVVSLAFPADALVKPGFGYLIPSIEKESLLGALFDSHIFPQQNQGREVRLTAMVRNQGDAAWACQTAIEGVRRHLNLRQDPLFAHVNSHPFTIPQFPVGYAHFKAQFQHKIKTQFPNLSVIGNFLEGPSVDACVRLAMNIAKDSDF